MKIYKILLLAMCISITNYLMAQDINSNPLFAHSNQPIKFDKINADKIRNESANLISLSDRRIKMITAPVKIVSPKVLMAVDELFYDIIDLSMKLQTIASVYADDSIRNTANEEAEKLSVYGTNLYLNESLYKTLIQYYKRYAGSLKPNHKKFLKETMQAFEKNGMKLSVSERKKLQQTNEKLISLSTQFDKNIAEYKDSVIYKADDLAGVPENISSSWKKHDHYVLKINGPNYTNILKYANFDETRHLCTCITLTGHIRPI